MITLSYELRIHCFMKISSSNTTRIWKYKTIWFVYPVVDNSFIQQSIVLLYARKYKERLFIHNLVRSIRGGRNIRTIKKTQRSEVVGLTLSDNNCTVYQFLESELLSLRIQDNNVKIFKVSVSNDRQLTNNVQNIQSSWFKGFSFIHEKTIVHGERIVVRIFILL